MDEQLGDFGESGDCLYCNSGRLHLVGLWRGMAHFEDHPMRMVSPERTQKWGEVELKAGDRYVLEPRGVPALLSKVDGMASVEPVVLPPYYPNEDYNHKTLTILRAGGIGDILMLTPLLRAMNDKWPEAHLEVCCGSRSKFALPSFVDWLPYPANAKELLERDSVLNLTDVIETEFEKHGVH
ncbi:MAG: hypothetical protein EBU96_11975, partial [Actinobacteria bacterium]|nr:hypothetical protein [Actinomycetota bacterium]